MTLTSNKASCYAAQGMSLECITEIAEMRQKTKDTKKLRGRHVNRNSWHEELKSAKPKREPRDPTARTRRCVTALTDNPALPFRGACCLFVSLYSFKGHSVLSFCKVSITLQFFRCLSLKPLCAYIIAVSCVTESAFPYSCPLQCPESPQATCQLFHGFT